MTRKTYIEKLRDGEKGVHTLTNQMNNVHYAILELDERLTALEDQNHREALYASLAPKVANELESNEIVFIDSVSADDLLDELSDLGDNENCSPQFEKAVRSLIERAKTSNNEK